MKLRTLLNEISQFQLNLKLAPNLKQDDIGVFYIVTMPTSRSTLDDICFGCDISGFAQLVLGDSARNDSLSFLQDIVYITRDKKGAVEKANKLLQGSNL